MNILDTLVLQLTAKDLTFTSTLRTTEKALRAHVRAIEANGTRVLAAENKLMADAARITQSVLTPMEKYKNVVVELTSHLNSARISKTTWNRAMRESHAAIEALNPAIQRQNALLAHAEQVTTAMQSPMELYHRAMQRNTQALSAKYITTQTYIRAQQKLHNSLGHVQLAQQEESAAIQDGIRITTEMENHTERYAAALGLLGMRLRQRAIDQETYNRAVAAAVVTRDNADPAVIAARAAATQQQAQASAAAAAATAAHNAALADAAQITAANVSPLERYNAGLERAWRHWMADRIPLEDYRREVERLGREFDAQDPTIQARNRDQQRLNQIIEQGMTPQQRYNRAVAELGRIYRTTNMTAEQYRAVMNREYQLLPRVVEQERRRAESLREVAAMTERLRTPEEQRIARLARLIQLQRTAGMPAETYRRELEAIGPASGIAAQRLTAMGAAFGRVGRRLTADGRRLAMYVTAPIVAMATLGVRQFAKFDDAMTRSFAIMRRVTGEMKTQMSGLARSMALGTIQGADELGEAFYFLASAGLNAEQSMAALPVVTKFATAGMFNLSQATELLGDSQSALGLKTKDATQNAINMTRVSDVLVKAANESQASVEQFAHALTNKAAAALRNTNKTVEEGVAVLAAYADQGVKGEEAGEKLWMVLRDLQRASLDSKDAWAKLGLSVYDAKGKMRNMGDIVGDLETRLTGMTDKQRRMTFEMLGFQDRSLSAIMSLLGVSEKIKNYEDSLLHAAGVTEQVSNDQLKSFASQLKILWNHVKELGIQIGQVMAPWILKAGEYLKRLTKWFSTVSTSSKQWIIILASVAAAVGPALIALGLMSTAIAGLVLVANPWTLGLLVAAAALASFVYWLSTFGTTAAIVETTIRDLGKANDDLRKGHIDQASRLMQLIEKQSLTNEEQFEAIGLIKDLETVYGPLGVRLDANAKKLVDSIGLQKHLNDLMKEAKLLEKGKEEQEALKNIRAIKKEYADATKFGAMWVDSVLSWENLVGTLTLSGTHQNDMTKHTSDNLTDILNKLSQEEMALQKIRKETDAIYEAANKGDQGALNDVLTGVPAEVGKKVREQLEEIAKAKAKADAAMQENQWGAYVDEFFVGETDLAQAIENVTTKLHAQIDAYKQGHAAVMVAQLARKGATEEQLKPARDLLATLKEMELASAVDKIKEETKYMKEKGHELQRLKFIEQGYTDIQLTAFDDATRAFDLKQKDLELQAEADALIKKYTPKVVLLAAAQEKLDQMLKENKITLAQYNMAIEDIQKEIDAANKKDKLDLSPTNVTAVEKDSAEALRMFYEYMRDRRKINDAGNAQQIKDAQKTAAAVAAASTPPGATAPTMPSTTDPTAPLTEKQKRAQRRAAGYGPTGTKTWWQLANDKGRVHSRTESARRDQREEAAELRRGGRVAYDPLAKMADGPVKTMRLAERERNKRMWPIDSYQKNQAANAAMMAPIRQRTAQRSAAGAAEAARRGAKTPEQYAAARDNRYGGVDMPETRVRLREENLIKSQARRAEEGYNASARQQAEMKVREDFKQKAKGNVQDKEGKWVSPAQQQDKKEKEQQKTLETIAANTDPKNMPRPVVLMPANVRSL